MVLSMSSSSTERYKSRLFNFLNRQSIRLGGEIGKTVRQLKIATEFGVQILLYPVYLMVQAGRSTRQQLEQKAQPSKYLTPGELDSSALSTQSTDQPIEQILKAVEPLLITEQTVERVNSNSQAISLLRSESQLSFDGQNNVLQKITATIEIFKAKLSHQKNPTKAIAKCLANGETAIQGVASLLDSHNLVLVDSNNQILDILNLQQQEQITSYIVHKFGKGQFNKRSLFQNTTQKFLSALPDFSQHNPNLSPPVRWFWNLINWVQTSPIAVTTNLFDESQLTPNSLPQANLASEEDLLVSKLLNSVDSAIANLENKPLTKPSHVFHDLQQNWLSKLNLNQSNSTNEIKKSVQNYQQNPELLESEDPFQIDVLIRAAIDYFFKDNQAKHSFNQSSRSEVLKNKNIASSQQSNNLLNESVSVEDPWLLWEDLFSSIESITDAQDNWTSKEIEKHNTSQDTQSLTSTSNPNLKKLPAVSATSKSKKFKQPSKTQVSLNFKRQKSSQALRVNPNKSKQIITSKNQSIASGDITNKVGEMIPNVYNSQNQQIETAPEWLETDATTVGYVKHPLERLLEWLDLIMLWIENLWAKIWEKLKLKF
ncbi:hypothetical protein Sta7437_2180 [Stanieria cyanosphaera PCC 7437]|uniref:Uncharacterized protein n=1 Tax=Stanieria cyanosphaera (strain ATCC 29371 / PCC 7437) TaxID=111780 RepID=K9XUJ1_STAC7|nr:hypothetical protein [Stanieria cyanosphaera]AFZ35729.1 hypothetical protein Sta7437_2180 [Stanieria cyanosphaera PCC 7437]